MSCYIKRNKTYLSLPVILLVLLIMGLTSMPVAADNWGFSYQGGNGNQQLAVIYGIPDDDRSMREWYFGCRQITLASELSSLSSSQNSELSGSGCGIAFSWRYFFGGGYFVGVRNGWWRTSYEHKNYESESVNAVMDTNTATSRIDSLAPSFITGWKLGGEKVSFDLFIGLGREFNIITEGENIDAFNTFTGGFSLRF
ncbi:MAG: hypothetical protein K0U41_04200 [Gammaproteobacteria bacterium]|nr:hypothetical protein [Gammaproteobacteria bacterium]